MKIIERGKRRVAYGGLKKFVSLLFFLKAEVSRTQHGLKKYRGGTDSVKALSRTVTGAVADLTFSTHWAGTDLG